MKARTLTGTIKVKDLIGLLKAKTMQFKYEENAMTDMVKSIQEDGSISIPTISYARWNYPGFERDMLRLYNGTMGLYDEVTSIPDEIKIIQGTLLDGICYGYDIQKGEANLYTMRVDLFGDELEAKDLDKVMELNREGKIKALKLSYEYLNGDNEEIQYKLGIHRTTIDADEENNVALVPFISCSTLLDILEKFMSQKFVIKMVQEVSNGQKIRCVTENEKVLANYCDDAGVSAGVVNDLKSKYYPLDAFFYAPSIGAPSTSSMMTLIDLFRLSELTRIKNNKQLSEYGVQKAKDPIGDEVKNNIICNAVLKAAADEGNDVFEQLIEKLPKQEVLGNVNRENVSYAMIGRYVRSLKSGEVTECLKLIPGSKKEFDRIMKAYKASDIVKPITSRDPDMISYQLEHNVCRVVIKKKDGTYSSFMCTNSIDKLKAIYGENYESIYESFGVKARRVAKKLSAWDGSDKEKLKEALDYYGFTNANLDDLLLTSENYTADSPAQKVRMALYDVYDMPHQNKEYDDNIILVRGTNARIDPKTGKVVEYYKNIDINKIEKIFAI